MRLPIDPQADDARRAWVACPACDDARACATCSEGRNCRDHWRYLIANQGPVVHLQCPNCTHLWSLDTRPGRARRPDERTGRADCVDGAEQDVRPEPDSTA